MREIPEDKREEVVRIAARVPMQDGEYRNPADGLLYCLTCGQQRQTAVQFPFDRKYRTPRCMCRCQQEAEAKRREAEKRHERMERIKLRKQHGLHDLSLYHYTFANDSGENPLMDKARAYVTNWEEAYRNNTGLLLFGDVGTGKSFFAACIANALLEQDIPVLMTSFPKILNSGWSLEDRGYFLSRLRDYDLLILDDLGAERGTEYALEQVYNVVDIRYRSGKPMIVTTNLKLREMKNPPDIAHGRIYSRILERCAPILFGGKDFRYDSAQVTKEEARRIVASAWQTS